ncbi:hypothetical protein jhhlp_005372 [Lomentospora prolificans]|uniref:DUF967 domain protein n=1 Tax=Lomentospora prolificans TaxID=41688 RepID=A0A2N3N6R0_9PEZI|nr:hypothetical protein jhhlp_005372 [Lomentospora prolificans]
MSQSVLRRRNTQSGFGLEADLAQIRNTESPRPIPGPPSETSQDAYELGHLLHARLLPLAAEKPTVISITLATGQVLFQAAVGSGTLPDNETWVQRKRNSVLRWGCSTWFLNCKYKGDQEAFRAKFAFSQEQASQYAIHGGGVPIRVKGVEGIVAVVVVSGLTQDLDHGVIVDVIKENWA